MTVWSFLPWQLTIAYVIDLVLGDPRWMPHPVRWIGRLITDLESLLYDSDRSHARQRFTGFVLWLAVVATVVAAVAGLQALTWLIGVRLNQAVAIWLAYTSLAVKSLHSESRDVVRFVEHDDLIGARKALSRIVSRNTSQLDEQRILRAVHETVSENLSDGIVAPFFYLALGGPIAALAYKAVNTMDSMLGYTNERYRYLGWFAARADDWANWIPARLTAILVVLAAAVRGLDWRGARRYVRRDARKMKSPNAGYAEAACAGALEVQLGGDSVYFGKVTSKPELGEAKRPLSIGTYHRLIQLMYLVSVCTFGLAVVIRYLFTLLT